MRMMRAALAAGLVVFTASAVSAQENAAPACAPKTTVPLPPVVVDTKAEQSKPPAAKKKKKTAAAAKPQGTAQAPAPAPQQQRSNVDGKGTKESAFGPVPGFVATQSAGGTKTDTPLIEIPQSVSI